MLRAYLMFSILNTHPLVKPQAKQVCRGPALSNQSETPRYLVHTCVGKFRNGREIHTHEIYGGAIVVKPDRLLSSWSAGVVGAVRVVAWEPVDLDARHHFITVKSHIMVMVWLKHLWGSQEINSSINSHDLFDNWVNVP